jgi:Cu-processing system ATP-binding protein
VITIRDVSKHFGRTPVLQQVSLTLTPGRVTALVGPNGCGKSTLIKCVLGLVQPDAGSITLGDGRDLRHPSARAQVGYMPQAARFPEQLTGRDALALVDAIRDDATVDTALAEALGIAAVLDKPTRTLSGGSRQKLSAALAFRYRPSLLVLDEPTAGLDPLAAVVFKDAVRAARARGATILLTTHVVAELDSLADDIVFLLDGRVQSAGAATAMLAETGTTSLEAALAQRLRAAQSVAVTER